MVDLDASGEDEGPGAETADLTLEPTEPSSRRLGRLPHGRFWGGALAVLVVAAIGVSTLWPEAEKVDLSEDAAAESSSETTLTTLVAESSTTTVAPTTVTEAVEPATTLVPPAPATTDAVPAPATTSPPPPSPPTTGPPIPQSWIDAPENPRLPPWSGEGPAPEWHEALLVVVVEGGITNWHCEDGDQGCVYPPAAPALGISCTSHSDRWVQFPEYDAFIVGMALHGHFVTFWGEGFEDMVLRCSFQPSLDVALTVNGSPYHGGIVETSDRLDVVYRYVGSWPYLLYPGPVALP